MLLSGFVTLAQLGRPFDPNDSVESQLGAQIGPELRSASGPSEIHVSRILMLESLTC